VNYCHSFGAIHQSRLCNLFLLCTHWGVKSRQAANVCGTNVCGTNVLFTVPFNMD